MWIYVYPNNTETEITNLYVGIPFPESITLDKNSITLTTIGQTEQLTATLTPTPCDQSITWSSDAPRIATVDQNWLVTCEIPWTATITATTVNGLTASCSVWQWWQPWANTLLYYKLDYDYTDYLWNYNLTNGWQTTIGTLWWVDCAIFNGTSGWLYNSSVANLPLGWNAMTVSTWLYPTAFSTSEQNVWWFGRNSNSQYFVNHKLNPISIWNRWWWIESSTVATLNTWQNVVITKSWNNCQIFLNGSLIKTWTQTNNMQWTELNIGYAYWNNSTSFNYRWWVSEFIMEWVVWSAQEVADYYNLTKSLYGIS